MITIQQSKTADTRTCDVTTVSQQQLLDSSKQHIGDVQRALAFFAGQITEAGIRHDDDKITDIAGFYRDFQTKFERTDWWDAHRRLNRHHLTQDDGVPADVNLIDVLDFIADCVMAGMGRSGSVYPLKLSPELLERAFQNTVEMLKSQVVVSAALEGAATPPKLFITEGEASQLMQFVIWHGGAHDHDCPADDTCDCSGKPLNEAVNGILKRCMER